MCLLPVLRHFDAHNLAEVNDTYIKSNANLKKRTVIEKTDDLVDECCKTVYVKCIYE